MVPYLPLVPKYPGRLELLPHAAADTEHVSRVEGASQAVDQIIGAIRFKEVVNLKGDLPEGYTLGGSKTVAGHRYCLLAHAGFFIDPLYSTGLALSTAMVDQTAEILMQCFKTNDFSMPQFERMNQFFANNITYADKVVGSSFVSFRDYELWDAWYRVWVLGLFIGTATNATIYLKYIETGDLEVLRNSVRPPNDMILDGRYRCFPGVHLLGPTVGLAVLCLIRVVQRPAGWSSEARLRLVDEAPVSLNCAAVEMNLAVGAQILDHVPVDGRLIHATGLDDDVGRNCLHMRRTTFDPQAAL